VGQEGPDELTAGFVVGDGVDGGTTVHEIGGLLEDGRDLGAGGFLAGLFGAGGELLAGDTLLFAAEKVERDGFGVGEFEQLAGFLL